MLQNALGLLFDKTKKSAFFNYSTIYHCCQSWGQGFLCTPFLRKYWAFANQGKLYFLEHKFILPAKTTCVLFDDTQQPNDILDTDMNPSTRWNIALKQQNQVNLLCAFAQHDSEFTFWKPPFWEGKKKLCYQNLC